MRVKLDPEGLIGSIVKSGITMAATALLGPLGGIAAAAEPTSSQTAMW